MAASLPQETPRPAVYGMVEPFAAEHGSVTCQLVLILQLLRATVVYRHVTANSLQTDDS